MFIEWLSIHFHKFIDLKEGNVGQWYTDLTQQSVTYWQADNAQAKW